jgi:DNA-binding response OmpR family regulator
VWALADTLGRNRRVPALQKIEDDLDHPTFIISVRNVGYRFNENITRS